MAKKRRKKKVYIKNKTVILTAVAVLAVTLISVSSYVMLGKYNGLGEEKDIAVSPYLAENFSMENGRVFYEDDKYEGETVIDISTFQQEVDFESVKAYGISGVMIRLGYRGADAGKLNLDDRFSANMEGADKAGLNKGVYFFSQAVNTDEAIEEARFVVRNIRGKGVNLPVAFDMEPVAGSDRINHLTVKERTEIADAFCEVIKRNGYEPVIYGNPTWLYNNIDMRYLTDYGLWLAHYTDLTDFNMMYNMWQYTDSGSVSGIEGYVDMNIYIKEKE